jgi:hypothetical protein
LDSSDLELPGFTELWVVREAFDDVHSTCLGRFGQRGLGLGAGYEFLGVFVVIKGDPRVEWCRARRTGLFEWVSLRLWSGGSCLCCHHSFSRSFRWRHLCCQHYRSAQHWRRWRCSAVLVLSSRLLLGESLNVSHVFRCRGCWCFNFL